MNYTMVQLNNGIIIQWFNYTKVQLYNEGHSNYHHFTFIPLHH
jgi:hypothetical protein